MISKFPIDDPVLLNAEVADIRKTLHTSFQQVQYFTDRFHCLMPEELDKLEEFLTYQVAALPAAVIMAERLDTAWHLISQTKDSVTGNRRFQNINAVMKGILVIFHSNADCERTFSFVTKNKTLYRANMSLGSLMSAMSKPFHSVEHSQELLKKAKSATYVHCTYP